MTRGKIDSALLAFSSDPLVAMGLRIVLVLSASVLVWRNLQGTLGFDDAFMFYRYALHLRAGLGVSWNLDGVPTLGVTSPLWGLLIWAGSVLPLSPGRLLQLASSVAGIGAVAAMSFAVSLNARSAVLKSLPRAAFVLLLCLCMSAIYIANTSTGMETMLSFALNGLLCGLLLRWRGQASNASGWILGMVAVGAFLTRPESALPALLAILLAALLLRTEQTRTISVLQPLVVLGAGILAYLVICKLYFHTTLPLSFYVKGHHFYTGYIGRKHPVQRAIQFIGSCSGFVFFLLWMSKRRHMRMILVFLLPLVVITVYLWTVTQIMGGNARYYVPYCPYLALPAMMVLDEALLDDTFFQPDNPLMRVCMSSFFVFLVLGESIPQRLIEKIDNAVEGPRIGYAEARRVEVATRPLPPIDWEHGWREITDQIVTKLPPGATAAATEVGYMGAMAPNIDIVDLSGLNDRDTALHGFNMPAFLEKKPDIVWLPHMDYTYFRGVFFDSKEFLAEYTIYDGALTYGIALRKDSPYYSQMMERMRRIWIEDYKGYPMQDYVVRAATRDPTPFSF
jgi:hypothetical protein